MSRTSQKILCTAVITAGATLALVSFSVSAAELRGQILAYGGDNPPAGAVMHADCKSAKRGHASVSQNGRYSIRGLPSGETCELWIEINGATSPKIPFTTSGPVARFSGQVRRRGSSLILMPD